jgi:2,3-diaminopropionate biosynthesis protein SbnA
MSPISGPLANDRLSARGPVDGVLGAIGNTPLVALRRYLPSASLEMWAKLEALNPGGSIKDRPAVAMLEQAIASGLVTPTTTVIESSSGNLGVGLAQACSYHGVRFICVVDTRTHATNIKAMRALGAEVRIVSRPDALSGDLLTARLKLVAELMRETPDCFCPDQYANRANPAAHAVGTMQEIDEALDGEFDYLFVATSTTGTLRGCGDYLRKHGRDAKLVAVDVLGSALFGGSRGHRPFPGLGAGVETVHSHAAAFDHLVRVSALDCVIGCRRLAAREALLCGASSGGVAAAIASLVGELAPGSRCAAIFPDGGAGYLDTVYDDAWVERELGCRSDQLAAMVEDDQAMPTLPHVSFDV